MKIPLDVSVDDDGKILIAGISHTEDEADDLVRRIVLVLDHEKEPFMSGWEKNGIQAENLPYTTNYTRRS